MPTAGEMVHEEEQQEKMTKTNFEEAKEEKGRKATIRGGGRRSKRRRCQRNRTASCSSEKEKQTQQFDGIGGATPPRQKRHFLQAAVADNCGKVTKVWHGEKQRVKMARVETAVEGGGGDSDGTMAGGRTLNSSSGISARHHQTQSRNALKPRAPNNTTSFLMSDLEKRQQHDEDDQQQHTDALGQVAGTQRGQKVLGSKEVGGATNGGHHLTTPMMAGGGALLAEGGDGTDIEEQRDADFEECLFSTSIERIERLSREEVNRELLLADRDNRMLKQRVTLLRDSYQQIQEENRKLKSLLSDNGMNSL
ncbi:hypothetical protein niasHT_013623 [Heterodera trifolii]|uniref:Uncharacterized protein n=1 Tax=Heterodera trifolii TaxID=157864 RepID=A0ABD2LHP0_9BILA